MANTIELAKLYKPYLDKVLALTTLTGDIALNPAFIKPSDMAGQVLIAKLEMDGLGDYSKANGFEDGSVNLTWKPYSLQYDRAKSFQIDAMDNFDSMDITTANVMAEFIRLKVVPEMDAIRFARIASAALPANVSTTALTSANIISEVNKATTALYNAGITANLMHVESATYNLLKDALIAQRILGQGEAPNSNFFMYDGMKVVKVPQSLFHTVVNTTSNGFTVAGDEIKFIILNSNLVGAVVKHEVPRIFTPDVNQTADATKMQYRIHHDLIISDNAKSGIYVCKAGA